ncbi:MAG TPA: hypothetical protein PKD53_18760 [Chloroflexaceae bacterium]|nr:hypothetical protein [Chloroflexaceae bacterium]
MDEDTCRQLRGGVELVEDAVEAAVGAIEATHQAIARQVYAPFALLGPLAAPALAIERVQAAIAGQVYGTVRAVGRAVACGAGALLERQVERR